MNYDVVENVMFSINSCLQILEQKHFTTPIMNLNFFYF